MFRETRRQVGMLIGGGIATLLAGSAVWSFGLEVFGPARNLVALLIGAIAAIIGMAVGAAIGGKEDG